MTTVCALLFVVISFTTIHGLANKHIFDHFIAPEIAEKCMTKAGTTKEKLKDSFSLTKSSPDDPGAKDAYCFSKCLNEELGIITSNQEVDLNKMKELVTSKLTGADADDFSKCVEKAGKIATCEDMKKLFTCSPKMED